MVLKLRKYKGGTAPVSGPAPVASSNVSTNGNNLVLNPSFQNNPKNPSDLNTSTALANTQLQTDANSKMDKVGGKKIKRSKQTKKSKRNKQLRRSRKTKRSRKSTRSRK